VAGIFISHTKSDGPIVQALAELVRELFGKKITVGFSSSKELDGGIVERVQRLSD
jgi:hypothetical protein